MPDFLSSDVPLAPSGKTVENTLPDWYTNYAMQVLSNQQALSGLPYTTYQGPRVADFSPTQQQGFQQTQQAATAYQPGLQQAQQAAQGAAAMSPLATAQPYLQQSAQLSPTNVSAYMNPYINEVVSRVGDVGARTLREKLLPEIGDQFIRAGGYGGSRQAEAIGRAVRDVSENTLAKQAELLASGYGGALTASQNDLQRIGGLAGTAGQIGQADVQARQAAADQLAKLAEQQQTLGLRGAGALQTVGQAQQGLEQQNLDLAYQDFLRQQGYDQQQINAMVSTLGGVKGAVPTAELTSGYGPVSQNYLTPESAGTVDKILAALATAKGFKVF